MKSFVPKLLLMLLVFTVASAASATTFSELSDADVRLQEAYLASKLNIALNNGPPKFPELGPFRVTVHINRVERRIYVDLGSAFASEAANPDMEDVSKEIPEIIKVAWPDIEFFNTELRYAGRDLESLHPELFKSKAASSRRTRRSIDAVAGAGPIVVSAGHGAYYDYKLKKWTTQRDRHNGVLEDEITNIFANRLVRHLGDKVNVAVATARTFDQNIHEESGYPWSLMAGRYWLKERFPEETSLWNSRPESTESLREKNEDLDSRPLFANHVNARASIAIHTNAAANASARGARVFYQTGSAMSKPLADLALCYMRERVRSEPLYESYPFEAGGWAANYAELRGANMPAILVEVGFHTNENDAAAMLDEKFQNAAMLGLSKAYKVFADGGECEPFTNLGVIEQHGDGQHGMSITVGYEGKPKFPVELRAFDSILWGLSERSRRFEATEENSSKTITVPWNCTHIQSVDFIYYLVDADGVRTAVKQGPPLSCPHHCYDHFTATFGDGDDDQYDEWQPCGRGGLPDEAYDIPREVHWPPALSSWKNGGIAESDPVFGSDRWSSVPPKPFKVSVRYHELGYPIYEVSAEAEQWYRVDVPARRKKFLEEQAKIGAL